jgi:type II secretory pathway predicted ATPase ExeA
VTASRGADDVIPEHPFAPLHTRESFLETPSNQEALHRLMDGLGAREPFLLLTGDSGTGKTTLVTEALARWDTRVTAAFLAYPTLAGVELLEEIVRRLGQEPPEGANRPRLVACLERVLAEIAGRSQVAVVVVDDAHDLPAESLEELRLLVNAAQMARLPLEVLLVGLPSLETRIAEPALAALQQRVSVRARVMFFSTADTQRYLHHRVNAAGGDGPSLFSRRTCREVATLAGGVARRINALASESLRRARAAEQPTVTPEHVRAAASALWGTAFTTGPLPAEEGGPSDPPTVAPPPAPRPQATAAEPGARVSAPAARPQAPASDPGVPASPRASGAPPSRPPVARAAAPVEERHASDAEALRPVKIATHDAQEWVARFIGDKGPLQISSLAGGSAERVARASEPGAAETQQSGGTSSKAAPRRGGGRHAPSRSKRRHDRGAPIVAALVALVVLVTVALLVRSGGLARVGNGHAAKATVVAATPRSSAPSPVSIPATARVAPGETKAGPSPAQVGKSAGPPSAPPAKDLEASQRGQDKSAPPAPVENPAQRYTIDVGGYLDFQRALEERDRMQSLTGILAWVVVGDEEKGKAHRIVLGIFRSSDRATSAAEAMLANNTLTEARVVPLPPRRARR